ncbi:hypothetical protein BDY21DRAFT_379866 [Lineolata rhizophorae]|uniref:Uncharacterized protein n=1 Tax=Lineolata rhizophorae TaxID=578093 RepID=A0A6A6NZ14_9PEZI|nr:hypothetical protein BDY21DRAFT_379866 [Lineolata rhizophorae]
MKAVAQLASVALFASAALASPIERREAMFKLRLSSTAYPPLDGKYLSSAGAAGAEEQPTTVGVFGDSSADASYTVQLVPGDAAGTYELYQAPNDGVHQLGLYGPMGFSSLAELEDPEDKVYIPEIEVKYSRWNITEAEGKTLLRYADEVESRWAAQPAADDNWEVKWYDGRNPILANTMPVEVEVVAA